VILIGYIRSACQRWPLLAAVLVLSGSLAVPCAASAAETATTACAQPKITPPQQAILKNLQHILLSIEAPYYKDLEAKECQKDRKSCVHFAQSGRSGRRPEFDQALQSKSTGYPEPLYPENIEAIFRPLIERQWLPLVLRDQQCHPSTVAAFAIDKLPLYSQEVPQYQKRWLDAINTPDTLTVKITVDVIDKLGQHVAVVTVGLYRAGTCYDSYANANFGFHVTAISLPGVSNSDLTFALTAFAESAIQRPWPEMDLDREGER
jgi:hypothetical protein